MNHTLLNIDNVVNINVDVNIDETVHIASIED